VVKLISTFKNFGTPAVDNNNVELWGLVKKKKGTGRKGHIKVARVPGFAFQSVDNI
jgi:hypothetical protein